MSASSRWKSPEAKHFAIENPISNVYRKMQFMPPLKSSFNQTSVVVQADMDQCDLLDSFCIGCPILMGPHTSFLCSDRISACESCDKKLNSDQDILMYELMFEEAFFLSHELKCLQVFSTMQHRSISHEESLLNDESFWQLMSLHKCHFPYYYAAYSHLRRKHWVVRTGLQYGVHYMAYRHHPSCVHADYSVLVVPECEPHDQLDSWSHVQGIIRLCGNVAKTLLLLHISFLEANVQHPRCLESCTIKEVEVNRWHPQKHRMDNLEVKMVDGKD